MYFVSAVLESVHQRNMKGWLPEQRTVHSLTLVNKGGGGYIKLLGYMGLGKVDTGTYINGYRSA